MKMQIFVVITTVSYFFLIILCLCSSLSLHSYGSQMNIKDLFQPKTVISLSNPLLFLNVRAQLKFVIKA